MSPLNVRVQSEDGQEIYLSVKISNKKDITSNRNKHCKNSKLQRFKDKWLCCRKLYMYYI